MEGAQAMTFDEWWKDKTAATGELRDFGRKRKAYEVCWLAAQAQCAAGPWQDIKDAPKDGTEVLVRDELGDVYVSLWIGIWLQPTDDRRLNPQPSHFAPLREVQS